MSEIHLGQVEARFGVSADDRTEDDLPIIFGVLSSAFFFEHCPPLFSSPGPLSPKMKGRLNSYDDQVMQANPIVALLGPTTLIICLMKRGSKGRTTGIFIPQFWVWWVTMWVELVGVGGLIENGSMDCQMKCGEFIVEREDFLWLASAIKLSPWATMGGQVQSVGREEKNKNAYFSALLIQLTFSDSFRDWTFRHLGCGEVEERDNGDCGMKRKEPETDGKKQKISNSFFFSVGWESATNIFFSHLGATRWAFGS